MRPARIWPSGAAEGAEGLFHSLQRLLELADGVEVFPGHVAGSLCGKSMSSKPSTTIGFERRFNPTLQFTDGRRVHRGRRRDQRAEAAEPRAHRRGEPRPVRRRDCRSHRSSPHRPTAPSCSTCGPAAPPRRSSRRARSTCRSPGSSFATKAGFVLDARGRSACSPRPSTRLSGRSAASTRSRSSTSPATCSAAARSTTDAVDVDELEELIADGREVIDVREEDERDDGLHPRQPQLPYRLVARLRRPPRRRAGGDDLRERRPRSYRREHPPRPRLRRTAGHRRWAHRVAPAWRRVAFRR